MISHFCSFCFCRGTQKVWWQSWSRTSKVKVSNSYWRSATPAKERRRSSKNRCAFASIRMALWFRFESSPKTKFELCTGVYQVDFSSRNTHMFKCCFCDLTSASKGGGTHANSFRMVFLKHSENLTFLQFICFFFFRNSQIFIFNSYNLLDNWRILAKSVKCCVNFAFFINLTILLKRDKC